MFFDALNKTQEERSCVFDITDRVSTCSSVSIKTITGARPHPMSVTPTCCEICMFKWMVSWAG